jgi:protein gp37
MGVSVENADYAYRSELLRQVPANIRFLSVEPLLGPIPALPLAGIHWVIVGDESGPEARPHPGGTRPEWVEEIYDQCRAAECPL